MIASLQRAHAVLAACALALPAAAQVAPQVQGGLALAPSFEQVDLFQSGTFGTHTYRIPALAVMPSGTLVAVCDARRDNSGDLPGNIDIVLRRSTDGGRTWSPQVVIEDLPNGHGAGDPSLLVDRVTGRLFCFYAYGPPGIGWGSSQGGSNSTTATNTLHAHMMVSQDDGLTWSPAQDLNPQIKEPSWRALFASSGTGIQLRSGRLLQPYAVKDANGGTSSRNAYSDDHGVTWQMGGPAGTGTNESKLVELGDGTVMQNLRHNGVNARFVSYSTDGGVTFGPMIQDANLIDPRVNAGLSVIRAQADGDPDDLLAFTNPWSTSGRVNLEVRLSPDEGQTWPRWRLVHPGPAAYSTLAPLPSGELGLLYERGAGSAYELITFARFTEGWVDDRPQLLGRTGLPNPSHPDLWAWLDASDPASLNGPGIDSDGDPVTRWDDLAWTGLHDLPRNTDGVPVLRTGAIQGRSAIEFNGSSDLWGSAGGEFGIVTGAVTLAIVARVDSLSGPAYLFDKSTGQGGLGLRVNAGRFEVHAQRTYGGPVVDEIYPSFTNTSGSWRVHLLELDGDHLRHWINGALALSAFVPDGGQALGQRGLILGADFQTNGDCAAQVAEVIVFRRALTPAERGPLVWALRSRYGL
ncbi:MAG: exo-alpha-sialidase [Planctomycetes bacterium]|nr:exo-alpha-sialidase [Planctomycetota bacterium]MDA0947156.1 exo-alpha-sialidase [Planctomycetota bacterium]